MWQHCHPGLSSPVEVTTAAVPGQNEGWGPWEDLVPLQLLSQCPGVPVVSQPQRQKQNAGRGVV